MTPYIQNDGQLARMSLTTSCGAVVGDYYGVNSRIKELRVMVELGYCVFNMNDKDFVAAHDRDEAIEFYMATEKVPRSTLHVNPPQLRLDEEFLYIDTEDSEPRTVSYRQLIREALTDHLFMPCILVAYIVPANGNSKLN